MIAYKIIADDVVYLGETSLVDCSRYYFQSSADSLDTLNVDAAPSFGGYIDITAEKKVVITGEVLGTFTIDSTISSTLSDTGGSTHTYTVVDKSTLSLFCKDNDLKTIEPDIMNYLPFGYTAWTREIVQANKEILDWLFIRGIVKDDGTSYVAADITNIEEVRRWATYLTLTRIFEALSNQVDDVFSVKAKKYSDMAEKLSAMSIINLKQDGVTSSKKVLSNITAVRQ
jgi:hypothetical protein